MARPTLAGLVLLLLAGAASPQPHPRFLHHRGRHPTPPRTLGHATSAAGGNSSTGWYRPTAYGADPTGVADSSAAFGAMVAAAWAAAQARAPLHELGYKLPDLGGAVFDLEGGTYELSQPVVLPGVGGANFGLQDGTLRAGPGFPGRRFLLELNASSSSTTFMGVTLSNVLFNGNDRAGGVACVLCYHVVVDRVWVSDFRHYGYFAYEGHENYVSNSWFSQPSADYDGIGVALQSSDSSLVDSVIFNTRLGFYLNSGNCAVENVHVYNSGHRHDDHGDPSLFPSGGGYITASGVRLLGAYFDDCTLVVDNPLHVTVTGSTFLLGDWTTNGSVVLRAGPHPILNGFVLRDSYLRHAPSFDPAKYNGSSFLRLVEAGGTFNPADASYTFVGENDASTVGDLVRSGAYRMPATAASRSLFLANATVWEFDFGPDLVFPGRLDSVQVTLARTDSGGGVPYDVFAPPGAAVVRVVAAAPVSALVSARVTQAY